MGLQKWTYYNEHLQYTNLAYVMTQIGLGVIHHSKCVESWHVPNIHQTGEELSNPDQRHIFGRLEVISLEHGMFPLPDPGRKYAILG